MIESVVARPEFEVSPHAFQHKIDAITNRTLSPENIDSYADSALDDLVHLIDEVTNAYTSQPTLLHQSGKGVETASFNYFGLNEEKINETLDHISSVAELIQNIDSTIKKISNETDHIILPPDISELNLISSDGSYKENHVIPRIKTIVLLLSSRFDVSIEDPEQFRITTGAVSDGMVRKESYKLLELPSLERSLLVCDEEGNATFVFDSSKLVDSGITSTDLISFSKSEISQLLSAEPTLGTRLIYSDNYVVKVASLLEEIHPPYQKLNGPSSTADKLLLQTEQAPEGYVTKTKLTALLFNKDLRSRIDIAIEHIGNDLGDVLLAKGGAGIVASFYSPSQQQMIKEWIETNGYLMPPDDYFPLVSLHEKIPLDKHTISKIIVNIKDELGSVFFGARGGRPTYYYSPEQINIIAQYAESHDYLSHTPEGFLSIGGLAASLGIGRFAVSKIVNDFEPDYIKKRGKITEVYFSPEKQTEITSLLEARGHLTEIPQDHKSKVDFADSLGVEVSLIDRLIKELGADIGNVLKGRTNNGILTTFLSPDQQSYIENWMRERDYFTQAPEGYLTVVDLTKQLLLRNPSAVQSAVKRVSGGLGPIMIARGRNGSPSQFFSPSQQGLIKSYLESRNSK